MMITAIRSCLCPRQNLAARGVVHQPDDKQEDPDHKQRERSRQRAQGNSTGVVTLVVMPKISSGRVL